MVRVRRRRAHVISFAVKDDKDISVTRAVGRFFGHIWGATTSPVSKDSPDSQTHEINRESHSQDAEMEGKKIILRRTTIDEIEIREDDLENK